MSPMTNIIADQTTNLATRALLEKAFSTLPTLIALDRELMPIISNPTRKPSDNAHALLWYNSIIKRRELFGLWTTLHDKHGMDLDAIRKLNALFMEQAGIYPIAEQKRFELWLISTYEHWQEVRLEKRARGEPLMPGNMGVHVGNAKHAFCLHEAGGKMEMEIGDVLAAFASGSNKA